MPIIPLRIFITPFADHGRAESTVWTPASAVEVLVMANHIWLAANIQFHLKEDCIVDAPIDISRDMRSHETVLLNLLSSRRPATTSSNVFLINSVPGLDCDLTFPRESCSFVQKFGDCQTNGHFLAHELGHQLNLEDKTVGPKSIHNVMYESLNSTGNSLEHWQIKRAKDSDLVKRFAG